MSRTIRLRSNRRAARVRGVLPAACLLALAAAPADAQVPAWSTVRGTPLPGPAPSAVVAAPPLALPGPLPAAGAPSALGSSAWTALGEAEEELRRREEDLERCRGRITQADQDYRTTQEYLERLESATAGLRAEVLRRMSMLDRLGRGGLARLVLTAGDPGEARYRALLFRRLIRTDADLARRYADLRAEAETVRRDLERRLASQKALEEQLQERRRALDEEVQRHRRLISVLEAPTVAPGLRAEVGGTVAGLAAPFGIQPTSFDRGALAELAASSIAVPASFPVRADALRGGLALDLPPGTAVVAPAAGTVVFAGVIAGYGPSVLLRTPQGEGLLLGHLDAVAVQPGQTLAAGEFVGTIAPSSSSVVPSLMIGVVGDAVYES